MHQSNVPAGPASAPRTVRKLAMAVASVLALLAPVPIASACPACRCGDPSWMLDGAGGTTSATWTVGLVVLGNRTTHGLESTGQAFEFDRRASLLVGRSLAHGHSVTLTSHYVHRIVEDVSGGRTSTFAFGDLDLRGQFRLAQVNTPFGFTTAGVSAALGIPTGPRLRDDQHTIVDVDAQPGLGSWSGAGGIWTDVRSGRWGGRASLELRGSTIGWDQHQPPRTLLYAASVRRRIGHGSGLQLGVDGRASGHDRYDGEPDPLSGGQALFFAPRFSQTILPGWGVQLGGQFPLLVEDAPRARETGGFEFGIHWGV